VIQAHSLDKSNTFPQAFAPRSLFALSVYTLAKSSTVWCSSSSSSSSSSSLLLYARSIVLVSLDNTRSLFPHLIRYSVGRDRPRKQPRGTLPLLSRTLGSKVRLAFTHAIRRANGKWVSLLGAVAGLGAFTNNKTLYFLSDSCYRVNSWSTHPVLLSFPTRSSISSPLIKPLTVFLHFLSLSHIPATKTTTKTKASASVCSRLKTLTCHQLRVHVTGQSLRRTRAVRLHVPLADNGETKSRHDFPYFAKYDNFESSP
jgi:hypothetical protein